MTDLAKTCTRRDRSFSEGSPLKWSPAARRAFLTPSASMKSLVTACPIRSSLSEVGELPKTTTSPWRFSPPDEVIATSEYRSQLRRTTPSDSDDSGTSPSAIATPSAAASFAYTPAPSGPNVRSCDTTVLPRDSASLMLAVVSPGTLTMTRCTFFGSLRPASSIARCVASATLRIWPMRPTSSGGIGSEPARPTTMRLSPSLLMSWSGTSTHSRVTAAMCGVITPGQPPERTKMTCLATSPAGMPRKCPVHSRSATSAQTRPQSSWAPVPSVFPTRATSVSGLIFPESASACSPVVSAGVAMGQTNSSTFWAFITYTLSGGVRWALETEARHGLQLLREGQQLPLAARRRDQLDTDREPVVQAGRDRYRRSVGEAHRQDELDVAPVRLAEERRHGLDRHRDQAQGGGEQEVEVGEQRRHHDPIGRAGGALES